MDHVGNMKTFDRDLPLAEKMLNKAQRCMEEANSLPGRATVRYHVGILRSVSVRTSPHLTPNVLLNVIFGTVDCMMQRVQFTMQPDGLLNAPVVFTCIPE